MNIGNYLLVDSFKTFDASLHYSQIGWTSGISLTVNRAVTYSQGGPVTPWPGIDTFEYIRKGLLIIGRHLVWKVF